MTKDLEEMTSSELKDALSNVTATLSESGEVEQRPDIREIMQNEGDELSFSRDPELVRFEQADEEKLAYHNLPGSEQEDAQQKVAQLGVALNLDFVDLADRYGADLTQKFQSDLQRNRIPIPKNIEKVGNTLEYLFKEIWLPNQKVSASELDKILPHADEFGNIIDSEKTIPLHSRSMDVLIPARVRPASRPKPKAEKTYKIPDLSTEDMVEALKLLMEAHPERFR